MDPYQSYLQSISGTMARNKAPVYPTTPVRNPFGSGIVMPQAGASASRLANFANLSPGYTSPGAGPQPYAPRGEQPMGMPSPPPRVGGGTARTFDEMFQQRYGITPSTAPAAPTVAAPVTPPQITQADLDFQKARQAENWGTGPNVGASNALLNQAASSGFQNAAGLLYNGIGNYAGTTPQQNIAAFNQGAMANTPGINYNQGANQWQTAGGQAYQAPVDPRWGGVFSRLQASGGGAPLPAVATAPPVSNPFGSPTTTARPPGTTSGGFLGGLGNFS